MTEVVVVTGASRGIGAATARMAGARGYAVGVNYLENRGGAEAVLGDVTAAGGRGVAVQADVGVEEQVVALFDTVAATLGPITALVNNAGTLEPQMKLEDMSYERLHKVFRINIAGAFLCAREAVRRMSTAHGGTGGAIVNVSSMAARLGSPNEYIDYAASKGAIDTLTVGLAKEVAARGIRVNAVRPGLIYTDIHAAGGEPERVDRLKGGVPLGRGGTAEEVARAILWLLSPEASYSTGTFIDVAGGR